LASAGSIHPLRKAIDSESLRELRAIAATNGITVHVNDFSLPESTATF